MATRQVLTAAQEDKENSRNLVGSVQSKESMRTVKSEPPVKDVRGEAIEEGPGNSKVLRRTTRQRTRARASESKEQVIDVFARREPIPSSDSEEEQEEEAENVEGEHMDKEDVAVQALLALAGMDPLPPKSEEEGANADDASIDLAVEALMGMKIADEDAGAAPRKKKGS